MSKSLSFEQMMKEGEKLPKEYKLVYSVNRRLKDVAIGRNAKVVLVAYGDDFFGGADSRTYYSPILRQPTWREVAHYANESLAVTGDYHHCFLEAVRQEFKRDILNGNKQSFVYHDGAFVYRMCFGS